MTPNTATPSRLLWAVRILLLLAFGAAGSAKLAGVPMMVATFEQIGVGQWFRYVTGGIEVGAALLLLWTPGAWVAAALLTATMGGATLAHLFLIPGSPIPALVLGALSALLAVRLRPAWVQFSR